MPMMLSPDHAAAMYPCPRCGKTGGQPFRLAKDSATMLRILLRCDWCRHRWSDQVAADSPVVTRFARLLPVN